MLKYRRNFPFSGTDVLDIARSNAKFNLQIPNDLYNGFRRSYRAERECRETAALPGVAETIDTGCRKLTIEGRLTVAALGGVESLWIFRPAEREAALLHAPARKARYIEPGGGAAGGGAPTCGQGGEPR